MRKLNLRAVVNLDNRPELDYNNWVSAREK